MKNLSLISMIVVLCAGPSMRATPLTYVVSLNTASLQGTTGSLDFNFDPGPLGSQAASVQVTGLTGGSVRGVAAQTGEASGSLPQALTLSNGMPYNDFFQAFTFGSSLLFDVSLDGPALSAPDGRALSGSTFAFSIFSDASGTMPALTSDSLDGYAITVDVGLNGSTTLTNYTTGTVSSPAPPQAVTPEPGTWIMVATGLAGGAWRSRRRTASPCREARNIM